MLRYASERLTSACEAAIPHAGHEDAAALSACQKAGSLTLADVRLLSRVLRSTPEAGSAWVGSAWVHQLLHGASPELPARPPKAPPHPDLEPRLRRLRAQQDDAEYARMVSGIVGQDSGEREASEMSTYSSQMGVGLNLIVSMGTMFIVGAYAGGTEEEPYGVRAVVCGLILMLVALAVEMYARCASLACASPA